MGCKNCNQTESIESTASTENSNEFISALSADEFQGGILLKLVIFIVLILAIPLIMVVLLLQVFLAFFIPKSISSVNNGIKGFFSNIFNGITTFIAKRKVKRVERKYRANRGYEDGSELLDVEVFDNEGEPKDEKELFKEFEEELQSRVWNYATTESNDNKKEVN